MPNLIISAAATGLPTRRRALTFLAEIGAALSLPGAAGAASQASHPDAVLLALGVELERSTAILMPLAAAYNGPDPTPEDDAAFEEADSAQSDVLMLIAHEPATTFEGLAVKARALAVIHIEEGLTAECLCMDQGSTDQKIAWSILSNLLASHGGVA